MLNRQRALLAMLEEVGGQASQLQVTKWAFLCRQETEPPTGGSAVRQFVPHSVASSRPRDPECGKTALRGAVERHSMVRESGTLA